MTGATSVSASARVGFLVNTSVSAYSNDTYKELRGVYENSNASNENYSTTFTIFEPNGTLHSVDNNGSYIITKPLAVGENGNIYEYTLNTDHLTVQTSSTWNKIVSTTNQDSSETAIEEQFVNAMEGHSSDNASDAESYFYDIYLKGNVRSLLSTGTFYQRTDLLYQSSGTGLSAGAGATDDCVIVSLEKNVPQRIRVFFWLEGQDVDCKTESDGTVGKARISLSIELAGSDK
jgi:hypothetical protein